MFLAMMPKVKPWDNKLVRQAVGYAIDRDTIIKTLLRGEASRLDGPIGEGQYGYDPNLQPKYTYNPEKARELVKQAGFPERSRRRAVDAGGPLHSGQANQRSDGTDAHRRRDSHQVANTRMGDALGQCTSGQSAFLLYGTRRRGRSERGAVAIFRNRRLAAHRLFESEAR